MPKDWIGGIYQGVDLWSPRDNEFMSVDTLYWEDQEELNAARARVPNGKPAVDDK